jgi:hypothetical protein
MASSEMQRAELEDDGCEQIFGEMISSREESRPELERALEYCRQGAGKEEPRLTPDAPRRGFWGSSLGPNGSANKCL